jgi:hypothetical protein
VNSVCDFSPVSSSYKPVRRTQNKSKKKTKKRPKSFFLFLGKLVKRASSVCMRNRYSLFDQNESQRTFFPGSRNNYVCIVDVFDKSEKNCPSIENRLTYLLKKRQVQSADFSLCFSHRLLVRYMTSR